MIKILIIGANPKCGMVHSFAEGFKKNKCKTAVFDEWVAYRKTPLAKNKYFHHFLYKLLAIPLQKKIIKKVKSENPDLVLVMNGWLIKPKTLKKIKQENPKTKLLCYNGDNPFNRYHFSNSNIWIRKSIPLYDIYFIWNKSLIPQLKKIGVKKAVHIPVGYDLELHYPIKVNEKDKEIYGSDIAFIGTWDEEREEFLNKLIDYDLKIWGNSWEKANAKLQKKWMKKPVMGEEFSKVCNSAKIILNLIRKQGHTSHNMKTFEIPVCKGFALSTRTEEILGFFKEGKEIICFDSIKELKEKINYYLKHEKEREKIIETCYKRVINSRYSYEDRIKQILKIAI